MQGTKEWNLWCKNHPRPTNIPSAPDKAYRDLGWVSWADWLGRDHEGGASACVHPRSARSALLPFAEARAFVHSLCFKGQKDWQTWSKSGARPHNLPGNPNKSYHDCGWVSWSDWLGVPVDSSYQGHKTFLDFESARSFARALNLRTSAEWWSWSKTSRPVDIPGNPLRTYKNRGWISWADWLGHRRASHHVNSNTSAASTRRDVTRETSSAGDSSNSSSSSLKRKRDDEDGSDKAVGSESGADDLEVTLDENESSKSARESASAIGEAFGSEVVCGFAREETPVLAV